MNSVLQDVRYAFRSLVRSPGFTLAAVLTLAVGVGANTAVFSVIYAVILKPLPYAEPERLLRLYERNPTHGIDRGDVSPGTFVDWRARSHTLESLAVHTSGEALWSFQRSERGGGLERGVPLAVFHPARHADPRAHVQG